MRMCQSNSIARPKLQREFHVASELHPQRLVGTKVGVDVRPERRHAQKADRRRKSRSGRRSTDPYMNWRRIAWLFAIYAAYLSIRSLPAIVRGKFSK
jgi:hypothetical protein